MIIWPHTNTIDEDFADNFTIAIWSINVKIKLLAASCCWAAGQQRKVSNPFSFINHASRLGCQIRLQKGQLKFRDLVAAACGHHLQIEWLMELGLRSTWEQLCLERVGRNNVVVSYKIFSVLCWNIFVQPGTLLHSITRCLAVILSILRSKLILLRQPQH